MMLSEQETIIRYGPDDEQVQIFTCVPKHIRHLNDDPRFTCTDAGQYGDGSPWATFIIPAHQWHPVRGAKRQPRQLTEEQRAALAERARANFRGGG